MSAFEDVQVTTANGPAGVRVSRKRSLLSRLLFKPLLKMLNNPQFYLGVAGLAASLVLWHLLVEVWRVPRFRDLPSLRSVVVEWLSPNPAYDVSIYTSEYYLHIWVSIRRVAFAFILATGLGVPLGLVMGWSKSAREYVFPTFELLRPVPILAWVPLAIIMFPNAEVSVVFLTFIASFFATTLNTMLGVESIDDDHVRAAKCLGASEWQIFRHVIIPGALPFIFTGLQISVGVAWFSLVGAEMVSGQYGLGYIINTAYMKIQFPTIVIGMVTLGIVGYLTSSAVRLTGQRLMAWRERELALTSGSK